MSPELANDDYFSNTFYTPYAFVSRSIMRDNYPWIFHTFKKLGGEIEVNKGDNATFEIDPVHQYLSLNFTVQNIGL